MSSTVSCAIDGLFIIVIFLLAIFIANKIDDHIDRTYFEKYNKRQKERHTKNRQQILEAIEVYKNTLKPIPKLLTRSLRDEDFYTYGGCRQSNSYIKCDVCQYKDCPLNSATNSYYGSECEDRWWMRYMYI